MFARFALSILCCSQLTIHASRGADVMGVTQIIPPPGRVQSATPTGFLIDAMLHKDLPAGQTHLLQILADLGTEVNNGKSVGPAIEAILLRDKIGTLMRDAIRANLLANWHTVNEFGLVTPENLERMRAGKLPLVTIGSLRGEETIVVLAAGETGAFRTSFRLIPNSLRQTIPPPAIIPQAAMVSGDRPQTPWSPSKFPFGPQVFPTPPIRDGRSSTVDFLEINKGESVRFAKYGGGTEEAYINSADEKGGVVYAMVDPAKMKMVSVGNSPFPPYAEIFKRVPNTKTYTAPWNFAPVPGLTEKGIYLTTYGGASLYFLGTTDNVSRNRYRLCVITALSPIGLPFPSPFPKIIPNRPVSGAR